MRASKSGSWGRAIRRIAGGLTALWMAALVGCGGEEESEAGGTGTESDAAAPEASQPESSDDGGIGDQSDAARAWTELVVDFDDGTFDPLVLSFGPSDDPEDADAAYSVHVSDGVAHFIAPQREAGIALTGMLDLPAEMVPVEGDLTFEWVFPSVTDLLSLGGGDPDAVVVAGCYVRGEMGEWVGGLFGDYWFGFVRTAGGLSSAIRQGTQQLVSEPFTATSAVRYRVVKSDAGSLALYAKYDAEPWHRVGQPLTLEVNEGGSDQVAVTHVRVLDSSGAPVDVRADDFRWTRQALDPTSASSGFPLSLGSVGNDYGKDIATDAQGNVYVAGYFQGEVDFDPWGESEAIRTATGDPSVAANIDAFVASYDPSGRLRWVRTVSGPGMAMPHSMVVAQGRVYVAGYAGGSTAFEGNDSAFEGGEGRNAAVFAYDDQGSFLWARGFGDDEANVTETNDVRVEDAFDLAADSTGNLYVVGVFHGLVDLDPGVGNVPRQSSAGPGGDPSRDGFVVSLTSDGDYRFGGTLGGVGQDHIHAISALDDGSIVMAGFFESEVDFDPSDAGTLTRTASSAWDAYVARYEIQGQALSPLWVHAFGGTGNDQVRPGAIAVLPSGDVVVGGDFTGTADFDPGGTGHTATSAGMGDIFVASYDPLGTLQFVHTASGADGLDFVHRLVVQADGDLFATGEVTGSVVFEPDGEAMSATATGATDVFVAKYEAGGLTWVGTLGGQDDTTYELGTGIAADPWGAVYVTGRYTGTADLDLGSAVQDATCAGGVDAFVARLTDSDL